MSTLEYSCHTLPSLICPITHQRLYREGDILHSADDQYTYSVVDNIPALVNNDPFYENRWSKTDTTTGGIRNLLVKKQRFFFQSLRHQQGTVLDIGCGGGWKLFTTVGPVTGIDLSLSSLKAASQIYQQVVQADWTRLPFANDSFDFVVSSDVLGHVPYGDKNKVWSEMVRVLKPGGKMLHYIEAHSSDPLMTWCRDFPDLYQRYVIDTEGHIGMESARNTIHRFQKHGLETIYEQGVYRLLMYINRVPLLLNNEYRHKSMLINILVAVTQVLLKTPVTESMANLLLVGLLELGDKVLPEDWSNGVLVTYRKSVLEAS